MEAKSTKRNYGLPTGDQRAFGEYVEDVRKSLGTLPPLSVVIVVGPAPARALEARLASLEAALTIPVRFVVLKRSRISARRSPNRWTQGSFGGSSSSLTPEW